MPPEGSNLRFGGFTAKSAMVAHFSIGPEAESV